jgi:WD40 repeat protein
MKHLQGLKRRIHCLSFSPDGRTLAASFAGAMTVGLWELPAGRYRRWHPYADAPVRSMAWSDDGTYLAVGGEIGMVLPYRWPRGSYSSEIHTSNTMHPFREERDPVYALTFAPGRHLLATGATLLELWDVGEGAEEEWGVELEAKGGTFLTLAFTPDGKGLAASYHQNQWRGAVGLWDLKTRKEEQLLTLEDSASSVAVAPDGRTLAVASGPVVFLYDLPKRRTRAALCGDQGTVWQVAFHPGGRLLATAGHDGTVLFWDVAAARERRSFRPDVGRLRTVAFAPDGMTCAAGGDSGRVALWDVDD